MHYRQLGKHEVTVSEISLGCNRLGEAQSPDSHWIDLVRQAVDLGINLFDTSESYGWGRSEEILGQAVGNRSDLLIASKVSAACGRATPKTFPRRVSLPRLRLVCAGCNAIRSISISFTVPVWPICSNLIGRKR